MHRIGSAIVIGLAVLALVAGPAIAATVKVKVNGDPITDVQIAQRAALKALEGKAGTAPAMEELITEALELQEAKRLGFSVSDAEIDTAESQLATNLKLSVSNLEKVLTGRGVAVQTLRDRMRATLAWNKVAGTAIAAKVSISEADIDKEAKAKLTAANSFDYILKEVLFISADPKSAASRTAQANQYRKNFTGCANAVQLSLSYTDAAVRDIGRRHATQFPDAISAELGSLNVGGITKPRVVASGVSMLAVCAKEPSTDTTFIADDLRQTAGSGALQTAADKYLADLKAKAQIVKE
jgi:peptidyl-prolyl cis-trans isomerase SurA